MLHGNPSWCYLYRHMVPGLVARGHRVLAPDLVGMGRSDKPTDQTQYTLDRHADWLSQWLVGEDLERITLFCQDWGGTTGLDLLPLHGERFDRVVASNTGLPEGRGMNEVMENWLSFSQSADELPIGALLQGGTTRELSTVEVRVYEAPFPDGSYQASPKRFPLLIPVQPDNPGVPMMVATWAYLETWTKPLLTVFGDRDPVAYGAGAHTQFQKRVPGAQGKPYVVLEGPSHFIQEDAPDELVAILDAFIRA